MRAKIVFALAAAGWLGCSSQPSSNAIVPGGTTDDGGPVVPPGEDTTLPLEVIGVQPTSAPLRFVLPADLLAGATKTSLKLTLHNIRYAGEAAVSINGGADIALDGAFVRGWGGSATSIIDVPIGQLKEGSNTLTFRFLAQKEIVTGYRVVAASVVADVSGKTRSFTPELTHEDPTKWTPPDATSVAQGETLYNQRTTKADGTLEGACSDCHTKSGSDLQYFSYSNKSLRIRSMFHGFTAEQGDAIASFVRANNAGIKPEGTPYDPPFQPGAGNKAGSSSGAGLSAVLTSDAEFRDKVFGGPINATHTFAWAGSLEPINAPISFQLPDWHSWLPRAFDPRWVDFYKSQNLPDKWADFFASPNITKFVAIEGDYHATIEKAFGIMHPTSGQPPTNVDPLTKFFGNLTTDQEASLWRFVSVRAWDWMRSNGFAGPTHGAMVKGPIQIASLWAVGGVYRANTKYHPSGFIDAQLALQQAAQWFWLSFVINPGQSQAQMNAPNDYSYFSGNMKTMPFDSPDGAIHQAAYSYLRGAYEWHTSPATKGSRLHIRFANLPAGAVVPAQRPGTLMLTGDEIENLMLREMEADQGVFSGGEPMLPGYFDGWNDEQWSYVYDVLSPAQRDHLNLSLNTTFTNGVGPLVDQGWTSKDPLHVLLPLKCSTKADCPSRFSSCNAAASNGHGACIR